MRQMIRVAGLVLGTCCIGAALSLIDTKQADAAAAAAVQVVNTVANPVPVTGTVSALISGDVGLAPGATVKVSTTANEPLMVQVVDSLKQRVQGNANCSFTAGSCTVNFVTVPPDKRLVITHVSGSIFATTLQNVSTAQIVQGLAGSTAYAYPVEYLAPHLIGNPNGAKVLAYNHETLVTFGPNEIGQLQVYTDHSSAGGYATVMYSGYLEPAF